MYSEIFILSLSYLLGSIPFAFIFAKLWKGFYLDDNFSIAPIAGLVMSFLDGFNIS